MERLNLLGPRHISPFTRHINPFTRAAADAAVAVLISTYASNSGARSWLRPGCFANYSMTVAEHKAIPNVGTVSRELVRT